jgi:Fic/DOC family protein
VRLLPGRQLQTSYSNSILRSPETSARNGPVAGVTRKCAWANITLPPPYRVPMLMRDYGEDLRVRLENAPDHTDDLLLETLAFAEGWLLSIHPFTDFNGRVTRLFLRELLRRLELPPVDLVPAGPEGEAAYRAALRAGDSLEWAPLMRIWRDRFEQFSESAV